MAARTFAFALGALLCHQFQGLPDAFYAGLAPLLLLPVFAGHRRIALGAAFCLGVAWTTLHAHWALAGRIPQSLHGQDFTLEGRIVGVPDVRPGRIRFRMALDAVSSARDWRWSGCRVDLNWYADHDVDVPQPGEIWRASARLRQVHGLRNPGGFDSEHRALREGVCATGYLRPVPEPIRVSGAGPSLDAARARIAAGLDRVLADLPARGIAKALVVGLRGDVTPRQAWVLQATGTAHLMAISGLHVGLLAGFGMLAARSVARLIPGALAVAPAQHWGALGALASASVYAALAGFSVPTQRALVMLAVLLAASLARRRPARSGVLAVALAVVLGAQPLAVLDPGTWLSFAAVAGLMWALWRGAPAHGARTTRWVVEAVRVQLAACAVLVPLAIATFGYQPVLAPLANLVAVPVTGLVAVPALLAGTVLAQLGADPHAALLRFGTHVMGVLMEVLGRLEASDALLVTSGPPTPLILAAAAVGVAVALLPLSWRLRAVGALWLTPLLLAPGGAPAPGVLEMRVLDVGQGLSAVVRTRAHTLVYDAGPAWSSGRDAGASVVAPALRRAGVRRVDRLMVSHRHADHAGGVPGLVRSIDVGSLLGDPGGAGSASPCTRGQQWNWDGHVFEVLHPERPAPDSNDGSCVLRVSGPGGVILLPGDVEAAAERELIASAGARLAASVLVVPHHGSRTSSTPAFLDAVSPRVAVNSSGHRNRFRQPAAQVVARYRARGITLHDTACTGQVRVTLAPGEPVAVTTWQEQGVRFWHNRDAGAHCAR